MTKRIPLAVALAAFAMACSDPTMPSRSLMPGTSTLAVSTVSGYPFPLADGQVQLCKTSNVLGTYTFTASGGGASPITALVTNPSITIDQVGETECVIIYRSSVSMAGGAETITITENAGAVPLVNVGIVQYLDPVINYGAAGSSPYLNDSFNVGARQAVVKINNDMARKVTFTNTQEATPEQCDFITFGRLVWEEGGQKVVISGNAGGNAPGGGILGEFHIEVNGVDHHVADISTYGPIAAAPLASSTYTNSRRVTGTDKDGHAVDLRLWDGGEPGKGTDRFWFSIAGASVGNATTGNLIDQGNMQYHPNCRGPGE